MIASAVIQANVQPEFDESGYYGLAVGIHSVLSDLVNGNVPTTDHINSAYGDGRWPPLHPLLLAISFFFSSNKIAVARISIVIISSLTTPLIFLITKKLSSEKPAIYASLVHIFYPSFLAYSHYLWSETTFIFLLLLSFYCLILLIGAQSKPQKLLLAAVCGLFMGLGALTRSAMLPYILIIPLWLLFHNKKILRVVLPAVILSIVVITILPWISTLSIHEGNLTLLGTNGGYTLFLSNNHWLSEESFGSSMEFRSTRDDVIAAIDQVKKSNGISAGKAASSLAIEDISADFLGFIIRSFERVRYFISNDSFIIRHFVHAVYPPVSNIIIVALWTLIIVGKIIALTFITVGIISSNEMMHKSLIIILAITGMALPAITIANSRYYLPVLATLLPFVGVGINKFIHFERSKKLLIAFSGIIIFGALIMSTTTNYIQNNLKPSIYYAPLINNIDDFFNGKPQYSDRFKFKNNSEGKDTITITILSDGYLFRWRESNTLEWVLSDENQEIRFDIYSTNPIGPLKIMISSTNSGQSVIIFPLSKNAWNQWESIGLGEIEYYWLGGGA